MFQAILSIAAAAAALAASIFLVLRREGEGSLRLLAGALAVAAAVEVFDLLTILDPGMFSRWKGFSLAAESVLPLVWFLFSATHARQRETYPQRAALFLPLGACLALPVLAVLFPLRSFFYSPDFGEERILFLGTPGYAFYLLVLAGVVWSLVNLERTMVSASLPARWRIKLELVGVGSFLAASVFYYSQGLLYRTINMNLLPVRSSALLMAAGLIVYSRARRGGSTGISVSREMAFKSVVLFAVGLYLVGLGVLGEGLKYFGDSFQRSFLIALAFAAGTALTVLLLSESVRRRIRVFIHKHFYRSKYDYRTQWLQFTDRLSSSRDGSELLRAILAGYCDIFGMGCGALFLRDREGGGFRQAAGLSLEETQTQTVFGEGSPLLAEMLTRNWVVNTREGSPVPVGEEGVFIERNAILFIIPLFMRESLDGFVTLGRPLHPGESYNYEDYDLMKTMACQASAAVLNLRLSEELARAREMEVVGRISTFVLHDLKNLVYTLSLILDNAREHMGDPEFQEDMLDSLRNTVTRMRTLISRLRSVPDRASLQKAPHDLLDLAREVARLVPGGIVRVTGEPVTAAVDREELQKVLLNLLTNAAEATKGEGPVTVEVGQGSAPFIRVMDGGAGMTEEFMKNRLFVPFQTTKKRGLGIGLYQCRQIVEAHGGEIEAESEVGKGSCFTVRLHK